jgi:hypothetical protein
MQHPELLDVFRALANENRQAILFQVFSDKQDHTVGEIAEQPPLSTFRFFEGQAFCNPKK